MKRKLIIILVLLLPLIAGFSCTKKNDTKATTQGTDSFLLKSNDGGAHWEAKVSVEGDKTLTGVELSSIMIDGRNPAILYLGSKTGGLYKTENAGEQWKQLSLAKGTISAIAVDQKDNQVIYAGGLFENSGKIFRSDDGGENWVEVYTETAKGKTVQSIIVDSYDTRRVYAGSETGALIKSTDSGKSWLVKKWFEQPIRGVLLSTHDSRHLYVTTDGGGLMKSKDGGETWVSAFESLKQYPGALAPLDFRIAFDKPDVLYLGSKFGLLKSADDGATWEILPLNVKPGEFATMVVVLDPSSADKIRLAIDRSLYTAADGGKTWSIAQVAATPIIGVLLNHRSLNQLFVIVKKP